MIYLPVSYTHLDVYKRQVNGFSIDAKRSDLEKQSAIDGIKSVTEVRSYKPDMATAKNFTQAVSTWKDLGYKGEGMLVSIIDTGIDYRLSLIHIQMCIRDRI